MQKQNPTVPMLIVLVCAFMGLLWLPHLRAASAQSQARATTTLPTKPPVAPVRPMVTDYYGTKVTDNYRYMENLKDPEVQAWMKAQNDYTRAVLDRIPGREKLLERIEHFDQSAPVVVAQPLFGGAYLVYKRPDFYIRHGLHGEDRLLIDPQTVKLAAPGKGANVVMFTEVSQDSRFVSAGIAPGGSARDMEIHVFDTETGRETGDVIPRAWNPGYSDPRSIFYDDKWLPDNRSFVYFQMQNLPLGAPETEIEQKGTVRLHRLGTKPQNDPTVFGYGVVPSIHIPALASSDVVITPGSSYAIGKFSAHVLKSAFYIEPLSDLGKTNSAWRKVAGFSDDVTDVEVHGNDLYAVTFQNAPRYKIVRMDARQPDFSRAETVVPSGEAVVERVRTGKDALYVQLLDGGLSRVLRVSYGPHPTIKELPLPFQGTARSVAYPRIPGAFVVLMSWTHARRLYVYNPKSNELTDTKLLPIGPYGDPSNVASIETKVRSYDGTMVPLSIVYPRSMKFDGSNPTLLYGYGFSGVSIPSSFNPSDLAWYEQGGIFAVCHVRGGGEYGEEWYLAGKGSTKPNTWRDFIACAQYLIAHKYTSPSRLAGEGASGGGILIGRAITTRPDLFAAAIDVVGVSDMLRFETMPHGVALVSEVGSVKTKAGFEALYAMSPYAHVKDGAKYPAVLLETGANDPRVSPWQLDKMTARLQAATSSGKPILLRVNYAAGHGSIGATENDVQSELADEWSFLLWQFGVPGFQPPN